MEQCVASSKSISSIQNLLKNKLTEEQILVVSHHLFLVFGVGYNEGVKESHLNKQVEQYNEEGVFHRYRTAGDAASYMGVTRCSIYKAIQKKGKCGGFYWRYL
jgi:predicted transcriptional regulator YheO